MTPFAIFNLHESACVAFHLSFHFSTCILQLFTCVHLCSLVFICIHLCSTCVHLCSTCVHLCSLVFYLCSYHFCSFVLLLVWCFRLDRLFELESCLEAGPFCKGKANGEKKIPRFYVKIRLLTSDETT